MSDQPTIETWTLGDVAFSLPVYNVVHGHASRDVTWRELESAEIGATWRAGTDSNYASDTHVAELIDRDADGVTTVQFTREESWDSDHPPFGRTTTAVRRFAGPAQETPV